MARATQPGFWGSQVPPSPIPLLVWNIASSLEAFGSWFACLSLTELSGRKVFEGRCHGAGQRMNAHSVQLRPQLFIGSLLCARLCGGAMGCRCNLALALGRERSIQKVRIQSPNCYPGRQCGHPDWTVRLGSLLGGSGLSADAREMNGPRLSEEREGASVLGAGIGKCIGGRGQNEGERGSSCLLP